MSAGGGATIPQDARQHLLQYKAKTDKKKNWNGEVDVLRVGGLCLNAAYHFICITNLLLMTTPTRFQKGKTPGRRAGLALFAPVDSVGDRFFIWQVAPYDFI